MVLRDGEAHGAGAAHQLCFLLLLLLTPGALILGKLLCGCVEVDIHLGLAPRKQRFGGGRLVLWTLLASSKQQRGGEVAWRTRISPTGAFGSRNAPVGRASRLFDYMYES